MRLSGTMGTLCIINSFAKGAYMPRAARAARSGRRRTRRRTAAVVGGAAAVAHHGSKKRSEAEAEAAADDAYEQGVADAQAQQQGQQQAYDQGAADAQAQQAAPAGDVDYTAELKKLGELHEQGILTDEEFAAKKQEILAKM